MGGEKVARGVEEGGALRGQADEPRRPLDEPVSDALFEALQLHADRGLGDALCLRRSGEALEIGDGHEGPDGFDIECGHPSYPNPLSLKYPITQFQVDQAVTSFPGRSDAHGTRASSIPQLRPHCRKGLPCLLPSRAAVQRRFPRSASPA
jgi:hypothetical protein